MSLTVYKPTKFALSLSLAISRFVWPNISILSNGRLVNQRQSGLIRSHADVGVACENSPSASVFCFHEIFTLSFSGLIALELSFI